MIASSNLNSHNVLRRNSGLVVWSALLLSLIYLAVPKTRVDRELTQPVYDVALAQRNKTHSNDVRFIDMTLQSGILATHSQKSGEVSGIHESLAAGVCSFDFNNDGWLDILVLRGTGNTHYFGKPEWWQNSSNSVALYLNNRDGTFKDITKETGLISKSATMGCAIGDLNSDGYQDVFLANRGKNEIWGNSSGEKIIPQKNFVESDTDAWSTSASIADIDQDGKLDIYVTNYLDFTPNSLTFESSAGFTQEKHPNFDAALYAGVPNQLLINRGQFTFQDNAEKLGVENPQGRGLASNVADLNDDEKLDILIANDTNSENKVYLGNETNFTDRSTSSGLGINTSTRSVTVTNLSNSDKPDLFVSAGVGNYSRLFHKKRNAKDIQYTDQSNNWRLNTLSGTHESNWSPAISDFNMDGHPDIFMVSGLTTPNDDAKTLAQTQPNYLLMNTGSNEFKKQIENFSSNLSPVGSSRCAVSGDFNNDGAPDILVANNNGLPQLLINELQPKNWIGLILPKTKSYNPSLGLQIQIQTNKRTVNHLVRNGTHGFCWQDNARILVALHNEEKVIRAKVTHQNISLGDFSELETKSYNILSSDDSSSKLDQASNQKSSIRLKSYQGKIATIELLIANNKNKLAFDELALLVKQDGLSTRKELLTLALELPEKYQLRLAPSLLLSSQQKLNLDGIKLIRNTEDDRLAKWLFGAINHQDELIACAAMKTLEFFYREEEAMILSKYAALDLLIQKLESDSDAKQQCAAKALGEAERYRAIGPLTALLKSKNPATRNNAIIALGRLREREAFIPLRELFFDPKETTENRLNIINAMKQVNADFDSEQFLINQLQTENRKLALALAAAALSDKTYIHLTRKNVVRRIIEWHETKQPQLNDNERLYYLTISHYESLIPLNELKLLLTKEDSEIHRAVLMLMAKSDPVNKSQHLATLIKHEGAIALEQETSLNLSASEFTKTLSLLKQDESERSLEYLVPHIAESSIDSYIKSTIKSESGALTSQIIKIVLSNKPDIAPNQLCQTIGALLENTRNNLAAISLLSEHWGNTSFAPCFPTERIENLPDWLANTANESSKMKSIGISFFAPRSEKWARNLVTENLVNASVKIDTKLKLIRSLRDTPFASQTKLLNTIFLENTEQTLASAAANKLSNNSGWLKENADLISSRIINAIENNNEQQAYELARILSLEFPDKALELLTLKSRRELLQ